MTGWLDSGGGDGYDMLTPDQQRLIDEPDTRDENVCMHDVSMRNECRACYAIDESQHDALVQAVDSLADLDPCRDDTYHLDA